MNGDTETTPEPLAIAATPVWSFPPATWLPEGAVELCVMTQYIVPAAVSVAQERFAVVSPVTSPLGDDRTGAVVSMTTVKVEL